MEADLLIVKDGVRITDRCSVEVVGSPLPDCDTVANTFTFELTSLSVFSLASLFCSPGDPVNFPGNPEVCDGQDNNCDGMVDDGGACCGNSTVEPNEDCDDGNTMNGDCCSSLCLFESAASVCRAVAGACDVAETCSGSSEVCPADALASLGTVCRADNGPWRRGRELHGRRSRLPGGRLRTVDDSLQRRFRRQLRSGRTMSRQFRCLSRRHGDRGGYDLP